MIFVVLLESYFARVVAFSRICLVALLGKKQNEMKQPKSRENVQGILGAGNKQGGFLRGARKFGFGNSKKHMVIFWNSVQDLLDSTIVMCDIAWMQFFT